MIRILNAEPLAYCDEARAILNKVGKLAEVPLSRDELIAQLPEYDILIVRLGHQIDREVIDAGSRLKAIVTATTGLDHIDVDYADAKGVRVLSLQGEEGFLRTINATAEHTWALLLALLRRIPQAFASVKVGTWDRDYFRGDELYSKYLGIVGLGRIGRKVARYGLAFGMEVGAYDPHSMDWALDVVHLSNLPDLLRRSNVLTLHVPLISETIGMIGAEELAMLPSSSVLINTSRGEILDELALCRALESNHLAGAALDVMSYERDSEKRQLSPLLSYARTHDNLLITPHVAGATRESMFKTEVFLAQKLEVFVHDL